ncbi:hypothetical protein HN51_069598 [Arachis hypogaea]|nr:uncharacterized protein LOC107643679 isoform X1 [Arachis ipaensis]XP_025654659.1 uncharacterized protein LOC112750243 [Arachis hypogaea]QHO11901.1 hypothetical protein DS421_15g502300 [Arachis hypogaea]
MSLETFHCGVDDKCAKKSSETSESNRCINSHPVIFDWRGTNRHTNSNPEIIYRSGRSRHTKSNPEIIDGSESSITSERHTIVISRFKGGKKDTSNTQINGIESISNSARKVDSSFMLESSSDSSDKVDITTSSTSKYSSKHGTNYPSSSESFVKSEYGNKLVATPPSFQDYGVQKRNDFPLTARPPIQVMDRSSGYDASRIPSSIFEKPANPLDWSVASNESLFSLHVGNLSFNRDHVFVNYEVSMPHEVPQSGDLSVFMETPSFLAEDIHSPIIEEISNVTQSDVVESLQIYRTSSASFMIEEIPCTDQYEIKDLSRAESDNSSGSLTVDLTQITGTTPKQSFSFPALMEPERISTTETDISQQIPYEKQESSVKETRKPRTSCWSCLKSCNWCCCFPCPSCAFCKSCCKWNACKCCKCCS